MRIAVPATDASGLKANVFPHFGRCPYYTIFDDETGEVEILPNTSVHFGGEKQPPGLLKEKGVDILVCADLGRRAVGILSDAGIKVYIGAEGTVEEALDEWREGKLEKVPERYECEGHRQIAAPHTKGA